MNPNKLLVDTLKNYHRLLIAAESLLENADDMEESKNDDGKDWDDYRELRKAVKRCRS
jgi:hypothetical protein